MQSQVGVGTTFEVFFPLNHEIPQSPRPSITRAPAVGGSETILLVEDEPMVRELMHTHLEELGYTVLEAASGPAALDIVVRHHDPIALLVTDIVMPEMSGFELEKRLRALRPDIKVILVSGHAGRALGESELPPDATYLRKPFELSELASKIRDTLAQ